MSEHNVGPTDVDVIAVGHRVVHGGRLFSEPQLIVDQIESMIEDLIPLAPLHNPANLDGIRVARKMLPDIPHVAVFDTAFFNTLPPAAALYAINNEVASKYDIRRYGFHGTSHEFVSQQVPALWAATQCTPTRSLFTWATVLLLRPSAMAAPSIPRWA